MRKVAVVIFVLCLLFLNLDYFRELFSLKAISVSDDPAVFYESRLDSLKRQLPGAGVVGYITDVEYQDAPSRLQWRKDYYLTQYTLAPVVVISSAAPRFVVGNFYGPVDYAGILKDKGLLPAKDFGNGVVLFERGESR
ncbi:MAG: hypothetical protein HQ558_06700 [Candidatus Omnitrophica bacterium]|nr:hypothetical protein [Candidatus Omnitrophota bacterium]